MLSFRSILFAAAAFVTVVSAMPTPETGSGITNTLPVGGVGNTLPALPVGGAPAKRQEDGRDLLSKRGHPTCGDIIKKCHEDIAVIVAKIEIVVKVKGGAKYVKHDLVISHLWEVVALLKGLLHDLKLIVKAEIILGCTLNELAGLVAELVILLIELGWLVFSIVGFFDFTLCGVIATIGGLLHEILQVVFGLVDGLLILVVEHIKPYGPHCKYVRYTDILILLKIKI